MVFATRALSSAKLVSLSSKRGGSWPASRAAVPLAMSVAICTWRVKVNMSGARRDCRMAFGSSLRSATQALGLVENGVEVRQQLRVHADGGVVHRDVHAGPLAERGPHDSATCESGCWQALQRICTGAGFRIVQVHGGERATPDAAGVQRQQIGALHQSQRGPVAEDRCAGRAGAVACSNQGRQAPVLSAARLSSSGRWCRRRGSSAGVSAR